MSTCADNEGIDVQLEVLKPFSEKALELGVAGRDAGKHECMVEEL